MSISTLSSLPSTEIIPPNLMDQLTSEDKFLTAGVSKIIQQLIQENFMGALSELNLLSLNLEGRIKNLKDQIVIRLNFPRSSVEIAALIKILTLPFINGVKLEDKKKLTDKFTQELEKVSRLASFYEGSHRNMKVDCPMPLSQAFLSGRIQCSRFGQCDLHVFNATDQVPMNLTRQLVGEGTPNTEFPTRVTVGDISITSLSKNREYLFMGNARHRNYVGLIGEELSGVLIESFDLREGRTEVEHLYYGSNFLRLQVGPDASFNIDQTEIDENSPIRGLTMQEYEILKSCTRIYGNGRIVAFDLTLLLHKIDRIFSVSITKYLKEAGLKGLVLTLEGGSYHVVHLTAPFKWNMPISFLTSKINDFWRKWNKPKVVNNIDTLNTTQTSAYTSRFIAESFPLYRSSAGCHISLNEEQVIIKDLNDPTNVTTYALNAITPLPNALDPMGILFRDIISGQMPIAPLVEPLPLKLSHRLATIYSVNPSLYVGYGKGKTVFIDAEGVESYYLGGSFFPNEYPFNDFESTSRRLSQRGLRSINLKGTPQVVTLAGENVSLMKLTHQPLYPNFLLKKVINAIPHIEGLFDIKALKTLVSEYTADEEFLSRLAAPEEQMHISASLCDSDFLEWSGQSVTSIRLAPPQDLESQQIPLANPLGAAAAAAGAPAY